MPPWQAAVMLVYPVDSVSGITSGYQLKTDGIGRLNVIETTKKA